MNVVPLQQSDPEPSFSDFWLVYPRRVARKDALKAWNRLTEAERMAALVGIVAWRPLFLRREPEHIPHASTWLNGERWTDELPSAPGSSAACHAPAAAPRGERGVMPDKVKALLCQLRNRAQAG